MHSLPLPARLRRAAHARLCASLLASRLPQLSPRLWQVLATSALSVASLLDLPSASLPLTQLGTRIASVVLSATSV